MRNTFVKLKRFIALPAMALLLLSSASTFAQTRGDITQPGDLIVGTSANTPGGQEVGKATDNNLGTKYLNFDKLNTGFTITPGIGASIVSGMTLVSGGDAPERDPSSFKLEGSLDGGATWNLIASNAISAFTARTQVKTIDFPNTTAYTSYRLIFPTVANAGAANSMQITEVELLGNAFTMGVVQSDVTSPLDSVTGISSNNVSVNTPVGQEVGKAIDNSTGTKYLNFDKNRTGLIVTPSKGNSRVTAVSLTSGGDRADRDPTSFTLEGSNDAGGNWTLITSNAITPFVARTQRQVFYFNNSSDYLSYRLVFPDVLTNAVANSMQITEVELLGVAYTPGPATVAQAPQNRTVLAGEPASFSVTAAGTPPIKYQWYSNGVAIAGATSATFKTLNTTLANNNDSYWVTVSNATDGAVSSTAVLSVVAPSGTPGSYVASFTGGVLPAGGHAYNAAAVLPYGGVNGSNGVLLINPAAGGVYGQFYVDDLTGGTPVNSFKMSARVAIGGGTARPADGMAFSFGNNLPQPPFQEGEEGIGSGIIVSLDTWDNAAGDTAPAMEVKVGGTVVAFKSFATNYNTQPLREGGTPPAGPILTDKDGGPVNIFTYAAGGAAYNDGSFVPFIVELFPDNTLSVSWSNVVVFDHLPIPYTPLINPQFAFSARTGGATANHMVDDLQIYANYVPAAAAIVTPPSNVTTNEGSKAVFTVSASGSPVFNIQWYSNNVAIPGANFFTYVTPAATTNMNGTVYRVDVSNSVDSTPVSASATLTVIPAMNLVSVTTSNTANTVYVTFNKPLSGTLGTYTVSGGIIVNSTTAGPAPNQVTLNVSPLSLDVTYTVTVNGALATDGSALKPNPATAAFRYGFGAICLDFNDNALPPGTVLANNAVGFGYISNGFVHLADGKSGGFAGSYYISNRLQGAALDRLQARWRSYVGDGDGGGADGYSFNWAPDLDKAALPGEEGTGTGLTVSIDTWDNGGTDHAPGIQIKWRGQEVAFKLVSKLSTDNPTLRKSQWVDATVEVLPNGNATFNYDGIVITANLPGFAPVANWNFQFGARTGGANDNMWIDDVQLNCFPIGAPVFTRQPAGTNVIEGDTATFNFSVQGAPPLGAPQWYTNGVAVAGANNSTITIPGTVANNGMQLFATICNDFGCSTSAVATLTVTPAPRILRAYMGCDPEIIYVVWNKPVQGVGTYTVTDHVVNDRFVSPTDPYTVLVYIDSLAAGFIGAVNIASITDEQDSGGNIQFPLSASASTSYGQNAFFADFSTNGAPTGTILTGNSYIQDGVLHLTDGVNSQCGSFFIPDLNNGANVQLFHAQFDFLIGGGNTGADGFSFNWAPDITSASACPSSIEEGIGSGLSVTVDTFDNGADDHFSTGIQVKWKGKEVAYNAIPKDNNGSGVYLRKNAFVPVSVNVFENGLVQLDYAGISVQGQIPNYGGIAGGKFVLAARTGGANDNHWVDNLFIGGVIPDTNGPVIYPPFTVSTNVVGNSQTVNFTVTARDLCEGPTAVTCTPPSGSVFNVGLTTVNCSSVDSDNHMSTASFPVIVSDLTNPHITSTAKATVGTTNGVLVKFTARAGQVYHVESAPELPVTGAATWTDLGTATDLGSGLFEFFDGSAAVNTRFYRIRFP